LPEETEDFAPGLRSFWSGTITFGLVSVPVALYPATRSRGVSLRMVDDGGTPLRRRYTSSKEEPLENDDLVRGYELDDGKVVVIEDEELEALEPRKSRDIDLQTFVPVGEIDPVYFERPYFLVPGAGTNKAYRLLAEVMEKKGRAGIATFVMRDKEYVIAILAEKGILRAETLRFEDEIRKPSDVGLPKVTKPPAAAVKKFERDITAHTGKVNLREFLDPYAERLEKMIEQKKRKGSGIVKAPVEDVADEGGAEVIDLLEVLSRSLGGVRKPAKRTAVAKKKTAAKKRA